MVALAGWLNRQQQDVVEYLQEENRVLSVRQFGGHNTQLSGISGFGFLCLFFSGFGARLLGQYVA